MKEIRIYGRRMPYILNNFLEGAKILAKAAVFEGKYVQIREPWDFLRGGRPNAVTLRIDTKPINTLAKDYRLDMVVVSERDLVVVSKFGIVEKIDITHYLKNDGIILLNTKDRIPLQDYDKRIINLDMNQIAVDYNTGLRFPLVGAINKLLSLVSEKSLQQAIRDASEGDSFTNNIKAVEKAYAKLEESKHLSSMKSSQISKAVGTLKKVKI